MRWVIETTVGPLRLEADADGLIAVAFAPDATPDHGQAPAALAPATEQLRAYLAGERRAFDLRLSHRGTAFQRQVWASLQGVPFGQTTTYAALADALGKPTATRGRGPGHPPKPPARRGPGPPRRGPQRPPSPATPAASASSAGCSTTRAAWPAHASADPADADGARQCTVSLPATSTAGSPSSAFTVKRAIAVAPPASVTLASPWSSAGK